MCRVSAGVPLGFGIGAAEMSGADDQVESLGNARVVGIGLGKGKDLRSEPVGRTGELRERGPFGCGSFCFGRVEELWRGRSVVAVDAE